MLTHKIFVTNLKCPYNLNLLKRCGRKGAVMKKMLGLCLIFMLCASIAHAAFTSNVTPVDKAEIAKFSDDVLVDKYLDTIVEVEANKTFHSTSGFSPKDYNEYKALLKFRLLLLMEIHGRNLEIPQLER
jgi:hypothetical protein